MTEHDGTTDGAAEGVGVPESEVGPGWEVHAGSGTGPGWGTAPAYETYETYSQPGPGFADTQSYGRLSGGVAREPADSPPVPEPRDGLQGLPAGPGTTAPHGRDSETGEPLSSRSRRVAAILQIVGGSVGAGRWYLGQPAPAIAQTAVTVLTRGRLGWVWGVVDGVMIWRGRPRDGQRRLLRD